jgi:hypothetical protein
MFRAQRALQRTENNWGLTNMVLVPPKQLLAIFLLSFLCIAFAPSLRAQHSVIFASIEDGRRILATRDSFIEAMSPFDRAARMRTDRDVPEAQFLAYVQKAVLKWDSAEASAVQSALDRNNPALSQLFPALQEPIYLIKTTGEEETSSPYTRGNAIVLPKRVLTLPERSLRRVLAHEFFHIFSRNHPRLRSQLYEAIGFHQCGQIDFPADLKPRKITNPDAPWNDHCIRVGVSGQLVWASPILYSYTPKYDLNRGGELLSYVTLSLLIVERSGPSGVARPVFDARGPRLVSVAEVSGFFEQVGRNTQYIIHPEEVLADNIALLVLGERDVPSPEVLKRITEALAHARAADPPAQEPLKPAPR